MTEGLNLKRIALTPGEPAGIGPDLCISIAQSEHLPCQLIAIASPDLLKERAELLGLPLTLSEYDPGKPARMHRPGCLDVLPVELCTPAKPGRLNPENSRYVLKTITKATQGCSKGWFAGMVTAPVHKGVINEAGFEFSGHTEYIAEITGGYPVMMLATPGLRVALVTIHIPLAEVARNLTRSRLRQTILVLDHDLRARFGIANPAIAVCGLNPHAGEGGYLGREEIDIIEPVLNNLRKQGLRLEGPLPADTVFTPKYMARSDAVLAMFHDQGLPVLKHMGFGRAANITLGLPIVRTSVDHGTALELAGTGSADAGSLYFALETALTMDVNQHE